MSSFLDKSHTIAPSGYNRFLVPPAALAVHLSIGQAYAISTFNLPMTKLLGTAEDWSLLQVGLLFQVAIAVLGISAAMFGHWVEDVGPRRTMFTAALCFAGGFMVSAFGVWLHQLWIVVLGYGVLGGCGLGLGYISPVSTLMKWFPDRPGMATGIAIMGFGGGALIAAPLSVALMAYFKTATSQGVVETMIVMGALYFVYMMIGAFTVKVPAPGWRPQGWVPSVVAKKLVTSAEVDVNEAMRAPQFYLLWGVLCLNVTAGIGVLSQASPMIQEMFPGRVSAAAAGGFVGLLSLFNMVGRFFWASTSDYIGRRNTYMIFFALGVVLYMAVPTTGQIGSIPLFVLGFAVILSMYGGGFATIPAYLRDMFGTMHVGAIHGRLLTAWSVAGVAGPFLVNFIRQYQIDHGVAKADAYTITMYIMAALLAVGFACNYFVTAVDARHHFRKAAPSAAE
ncbi:MAG: OFA family MFS transporter [Aliidongia sp.]